MVSDIGTTRSADDRAQLILIGAISIAFILLGVVVVFNGVQYTETVSSGETGDTLANAETTDRELEAGVAGLIEHYDGSETQLALKNEIETYVEDRYQPAKANQRPVSITIEGVTIHDPVGLGSLIDVSVTYSYRTNDGTVTRTIDVAETVGGAI